MKAIFIDAEKREFREVEYSALATASGAPTLRDHLDGWIEVAFQFPNGDVMYVDEEGYLKPTMHFFTCSFRTDQPMAGNGIIVGREVEDEEGSVGFHTEDPQTTIAWLQRNIAWMPRSGFDRWLSANKDVVAGTITTVTESGVTTEPLYTYGDITPPRKEDKDAS